MCHNASDSDFSRSQSPSDVPWQVQTTAERSLCVCRGTENVASQDLQEFGVLHKQETESWRSRWLLPSTDVISPEGLNTPDLIVCLTSARTRERHCKTQRGVIKHGKTTPRTTVKQGRGLFYSYGTGGAGVHIHLLDMGRFLSRIRQN